MGFLDEWLGTPQQTQDPNAPSKQAILAQYLGGQQPQQPQAPRGILSATDPNDVYDGMIQAGAGLLAPGTTGQKLSAGLTGFNKGLDEGAQRRIAARKLSLEELKANKPSVTPAGVPGHVLLTYPDGRTETVVNDAAVQAYEAQQGRVDARQQAQLDSAERRSQMAIDAADRRAAGSQAAQLALLERKLAGGGKLNPSLQKSEDSDIETVQTATRNVNQLQPIIAQLTPDESGKAQLELGPLANAYKKSQNWFGKSSPESQRYQELQSTVTQIRNESLRMNKGVQTEGDAIRAAEELTAAFAGNDTTAMRNALERWATAQTKIAKDKAALVDRRRTSQGVEPLFGNQPAIAAPSGKTKSGIGFTVEGN
jgi:hypothetical protein